MFHYSNNAALINFQENMSFIFMMLFGTFIVYLLFYFFNTFTPYKAAISTVIFFIFFFTYGIFFDLLYKLDGIQIEHLNFLPTFVFLALYTSQLFNKLNELFLSKLIKLFSYLLFIMTVFNLVRVIPIEIEKNRISSNLTPSSNIQLPNNNNQYPDIYYIILDEAASFESARNYFKYEEINEFVDFLIDNGFYVAENSRATHASTLYQIASILNLEAFEYTSDELVYFEAISNNFVFDYLKSKGYTTAVINMMNRRPAFPSMPPIKSDYDFYPEMDDTEINLNRNTDFIDLVLYQTMLRPLVEKFDINHPVYEPHKRMIEYSFDKIDDLVKINSPKFVYIHLLIPHAPFMFDENGEINYPKYYENWDYYLGNYKYSLNIAQHLIIR